MADEIVWSPVIRRPGAVHPPHETAVQHGFYEKSSTLMAADHCVTRVVCSCGYTSEHFDDVQRITNTHTLNLLGAHRKAHRSFP